MNTLSRVFMGALVVFWSCSGNGNDAKRAEINKQSQENQALYNRHEAQKADAMRAGDVELSKRLQASMDSVMIENVKLGQKMMELKD